MSGAISWRALLLWLRAHPHTMLVITAAAVVLAVTFGLIRG